MKDWNEVKNDSELLKKTMVMLSSFISKIMRASENTEHMISKMQKPTKAVNLFSAAGSTWLLTLIRICFDQQQKMI